MRQATALILLCGVAACGDSGGAQCALGSDLCGVYAIDSLMTNPTGCEDPTEPLAASGDFLVLYGTVGVNNDGSAGEPFIAGAFCGSVAACQQTAAAAPSFGLEYAFNSGDDVNGWIGFGVRSGDSAAAGQCSAEVQEHMLTGTVDGTRIDTMIREAEPFPPNEDNACIVADAIAAAEGQPCIGLFLFEGTLEGPL